MINDRLPIVKDIDDLTINNCLKCPTRPHLDPKLYSERTTFCRDQCPVGQQLQVLGRQLQKNVTDRRNRKNQKPEPIVMPKEYRYQLTIVEPKPIIDEEMDDLKNNKITKAEYLVLRTQGLTRKEIAKKYGYTLSHLENYWLKQWLIKDPLEEDLAIIEAGRMPGEKPLGLGAINAAHQEEMKKVDPPAENPKEVLRDKELPDRIPADLEITKVKDAEIKRLSEALEGATVDANQAGARIKELEQTVENMDKLLEAEEIEHRELRESLNILVVPNRSTRNITIKTAGNQADVTSELSAILAYVGAMKGREFQLELYLGEVKVG